MAEEAAARLRAERVILVGLALIASGGAISLLALGVTREMDLPLAGLLLSTALVLWAFV